MDGTDLDVSHFQSKKKRVSTDVKVLDDVLSFLMHQRSHMSVHDFKSLYVSVNKQSSLVLSVWCVCNLVPGFSEQQ